MVNSDKPGSVEGGQEVDLEKVSKEINTTWDFIISNFIRTGLAYS